MSHAESTQVGTNGQGLKITIFKPLTPKHISLSACAHEKPVCRAETLHHQISSHLIKFNSLAYLF